MRSKEEILERISDIEGSLWDNHSIGICVEQLQWVLNEPELEDGIYEVEVGNTNQCVYVENNKWSATKDHPHGHDIKEIKIIRKLADI